MPPFLTGKSDKTAKKGGKSKGKNKKVGGDNGSGESEGEEVDAAALGLTGGVKLNTSYKKKVENSTKIEASMHGTITTNDGQSMVLVVLGNMTYWLKAEHVQEVCSTSYQNLNPDKPVPDWINSIRTIALRESEHGNDKYYRASNNSVRHRMIFTIVVPSTDAGTLEKKADEALRTICRLFKKRTGPEENSAGALCLEHLKSLPKGPKGGLFGHVMNQYSNNEKLAAKQMTEKLHDEFKNGHYFDLDNHYNRYLVNYDIRQILVENLDIHSWKDLTEDSYQWLFKGHPKTALPKWGSLVKENEY